MNTEFCSQCGHKNIFDVKPKFCSKCGKPFNRPQESKSSTTKNKRDYDDEDDEDSEEVEYDVSKIEIKIDGMFERPKTLAEILKEAPLEDGLSRPRPYDKVDGKAALEEVLNSCKPSREPIILE